MHFKDADVLIAEFLAPHCKRNRSLLPHCFQNYFSIANSKNYPQFFGQGFFNFCFIRTAAAFEFRSDFTRLKNTDIFFCVFDLFTTRFAPVSAFVVVIILRSWRQRCVSDNKPFDCQMDFIKFSHLISDSDWYVWLYIASAPTVTWHFGFCSLEK